MSAPLIAFRGVSKRFGTLQANEAVSFEIGHGAILGLLGENGAGKTTAMNVLAGIYTPDAGEILVDGSPLPPGSPARSVAAGIGMVHQQFKLVETLTGYENCMLARNAGREPVTRQRLEALAAELDFDIRLDAYVWQMSLATRQQLEILRTLATGARVLVLDEPTSVLSPLETRKLFAIVRRVAASGRAVVLISHKLAEVLDVVSDLVVMRQGRVVHAGPPEGLSARALGRLIVGEREIGEGRRPERTPGVPVLRVRDLEVRNDMGLMAVRGVGFEVRAGELVALVGVTGNGQSELMEAIGGLRGIEAGVIDAANDAPGRGFAFIPARHLGVALAPDLSIVDNSILGRHRHAPFGAWIRPAAARDMAREVTERFEVTAPMDAPVRRLSGGNLQRVVLGRELLGDPPLVVADYPTRGLDVSSAAQIRAALVARAEAGAAVLMSSEELEESLDIANRILVMNAGRIVSDMAASDVDMETLGRLMTDRAEAH